jgi:type VI secretion system protein ImpI
VSINIQLVEIPENEQVSRRQLELPSSGGTIGRAYDCTVQLPDFSKSLSRVHAQVTKVTKGAKGNYQVSNKSTNGMQINGKEILPGQYQNIADGDVWKLGGYLLLITDLSALETDEFDLQSEPIEELSTEPLFSVDEFDVMDTEVFDTDRLNMSAGLDDYETGDIDDLPMDSDSSVNDNGFSAEKALGTVQLGIDPFEHEQMQPSSFSNEPLTIEGNNASADAMAQNLRQLTTLIAQQNNQSDPYNYDILMQCIQNSMDKFIEEMAPEYLEEMFNWYITGWGSRDKKYWQLYKKQFKRKLARREFHRQFESIFMEELRGKQ